MKIIAAILLIIYWLITAILGISFIGLLLLMMCDDYWFGWGDKLLEMLKK